MATAPTLLSSLEAFRQHDVLPPDVVHPFATAAPETCALLQDLINTTDQVSRSLAIYETSTQWSSTKLISLLRQHTAIEYTSYSSTKDAQSLIGTLKARRGASYGESVPLLGSSIPNWCIEQLATWGNTMGMETFKDDSRQGGTTVVLGGKVLVVDVEFAVDLHDPLKPTLRVASVKTSNALNPHSSSPSTSPLLDSFLADCIEGYCVEMQKPEYIRDPQRASSFRKSVLDHLRYLVLLDGLASRKDDGGIRWFTDIDEFYPTLNVVAKNEASFIASSLSLAKAPLDIFLLRAHSLPLLYLMMPSISFLTYLSPAAYLSLRRKAPITNTFKVEDDSPPIDFTFNDLQPHISSMTKGVTIATLFLDKLSEAHLYPPSMSMPNITARPSFPLSPSASEVDHPFPQQDDFGLHSDSSPPQPYTWVLDFTVGGKKDGVVMSQSRMKAIELVVNPLGGDDDLSGVTDMLSFGTGSWVDLLLNPRNPVSPERYTALYKSPNFLHPPLQLRLTAPEEPGFLLQRIPVHSIKEVWGILEVVREQSWINETLLGCHWTTEGLKSEEEDIIPDEHQV
ncbi:hypothetical protein NLJ89_g42 [Agrocybe chaxingu]|uniref:Uncharacterized protein n=1 Tax=Agrocybe chaxingu TaxID=84603 RepID=A0A9W8TGE9_9AGAR|nr:hypothetical protein NLJ89_g42 [Agrocybe chaxingu]